MKEVKWSVGVESGKYIYYFYTDGSSEIKRYGRSWKDTTGDKALYAFAEQAYRYQQFIIGLAEVVEEAKKIPL